jgi:TPR repeat protein/serine/threonine protein kinase
MKALEEMTSTSSDDPSHYIYSEVEFSSFQHDINGYFDSLATYLALMKHHPLSVYEARSLKMELKKLSLIVQEKKEEFSKICETKRIEFARRPPSPLLKQNRLSVSQPILPTIPSSQSLLTPVSPVPPSSSVVVTPAAPAVPYTPLPVVSEPVTSVNQVVSFSSSTPNNHNHSHCEGNNNNSSFYYSAITTEYDPISSQQIYTKYNKSKVLETYRLSPTDIRRTKIVIEYGNFGNVYLGLFKNTNKITIKKLPKKDGEALITNEYLNEKLLLMHHLHNGYNNTSSYNITGNPTGNTGQAGAGAGHDNSIENWNCYIQNFYGFISSENSYQIIEELSCNGILDTVLSDITNFPFFQINLRISWILDIIKGIAYLHSKGIVHSEIAPGNLIITDRLQLKIGNIHSTSDILVKYSQNNEKLLEIYKILLTNVYIAPEIKERLTKLLSREQQRQQQHLGTASNSQTTPNPQTAIPLPVDIFSFDSDIYAFMITAFVIVFRKTPMFNESMSEQIIEALTPVKFYSMEAKELFQEMMMKSSSYVKKVNPFSETILVDRPNAVTILPYVEKILSELGGDPRILEASKENDENDDEEEIGDTYLSDLEKLTIKLQNDRIQETGLSELIKKSLTQSTRITAAILPIESKESTLIKSTSAFSMKSGDTGSHRIKNPSKNIIDVTTTLSRTPIESEIFKSSANNSSQMNSRYSYNNSKLFSSSKKNDGNNSGNFVGSSSPLYQHNAGYLHLLTFFKEDCHCSSSIAATYAEILFNKGISSVEGLIRRLEKERAFLINSGFDLNDTLEIIEICQRRKQSAIISAVVATELKERERKEERGGGENSSIRSSRISVSSSQRPLVSFSRDETNSLISKNSQSMRDDLASILSKDKSFRNSRRPVSLTQRPISTSSTTASKLCLPTDIAILYEKATLQNDEIALIELDNLAENGDKFAKGFVMRMLLLGQCGLDIDIPLARKIGEGLFSWLEVIVQSSENELAVRIGSFLLGVCYSEGIEIEKDEKKAFSYYKLSAERYSFSIAQAYLGYCYYVGKGTTQNYKESFKWYQKAATAGHAGAQSNLGLCYENGHGLPGNQGQSYYDAVRWYKAAAEQGYAIASYNLAYCYERGVGLPNKDYEKAFYYYLASSRQGYSKGEYRIGQLFEDYHLDINEKEIEEMKQLHFKDTERKEREREEKEKEEGAGGGAERESWKRTSLNSKRDSKGRRTSPATLSTPIESRKALTSLSKHLSKKRSMNGSTDHSDTSQESFHHLLSSLKTTTISPSSSSQPSNSPLSSSAATSTKQKKNENEAFFWFFSSASKGLSESMVKVGNYYEYDLLPSSSSSSPPLSASEQQNHRKKAFSFYMQAANLGNSLAKYHLGYCYSTGTGIHSPDIEKALFYYYEAAKEGIVMAQNNLGYFYKKGWGIEKNLNEAYYWFSQAALKDYPPAKYNLAFLIEKYGHQLSSSSSSSSPSSRSPTAATATGNKQSLSSGVSSPSLHSRYSMTKSSNRIVSGKMQEIINLYLSAANGGVDRAKTALNRIKPTA